VDERWRPDPDALLRLAARDDKRKGKLKIFFGMAAGVGKTYAMLMEARLRRQDGIDVVIGWLENHQRPETEELAKGIERIPRRTHEYRGVTLEELDLDAALARRPSIVLVDELAHTNAPGARNRKRYQDVLELVAAGIHVYTTVNVQHLESFADKVAEIAGVNVGERVPDSVLDAADEVVLIDLAPESLLARLAEGKVYVGEMAREAIEHFFKRSTLTALREMALRYTAQLVDRQLETFAPAEGAAGAVRSGERLLVAISPSPNSAYLIRWTRQRAFSLKAAWTALHVDDGRPLGPAAEEGLSRNITLARQLGAAVITMPAERVAEAVVEFARANHVSQIVVGKSGLRNRGMLPGGRSVTDRILAKSGDIDVAVVKERDQAIVHRGRRFGPGSQTTIVSFLIALGTIALVTLASMIALPRVGYRSVAIVYLLAIIALAFATGRGALIAAAAFSALAWDYFFIPPQFTFSIGKLEDVLMFALYFVTAAALAFLMSRIRTNQRLLAVRERRMTALYGFSQELSEQHDLAGIVRTSLERMSRTFEAECLLFLRDPSGTLGREAHALQDIAVDDKEFGMAQWCFTSRTSCGRFTDTLSLARYRYAPLVTSDAAVGVLGIRPLDDRAPPRDQEEFLQALARNLSLALERELLAEENRRNLMARESERLGRVLLNSVSHEMRTPLTTIKGSVTALQDPATVSDPEARDILLGETLTAADRLNAIVENLLSMSRIESGTVRLRRSPTDVFDFASVVADALRRQSRVHPLSIHIDENVPRISMDFTLMVQAVSNILTNAAQHTPPGTPIELHVQRIGRDALVTVSDEGPGVPSPELPHLFDMFFRGQRAATGGVGLGLSICKGIAEAHGGTVTASASPRGGLSISILLPDSVVDEPEGSVP
jgi:two-component system sensor histidine kinase KdpD